ncbi:hypothetical protein [Microbacterium sp. UCD-TDU]|uniref:hypothetical protein n=1 Tax=Microbacterium sp. UCD-TDU TaxID=1247714 RepID=UPI0003625E5E|nr:hypothetical protein [Microbacterium sp. UCD-TDU]
MKFHHLDEDTGTITVCRSPRTCQREWHYLTVADAQAAYEEGMRDSLVPTPLTKEAR